MVSLILLALALGIVSSGTSGQYISADESAAAKDQPLIPGEIIVKLKLQVPQGVMSVLNTDLYKIIIQSPDMVVTGIDTPDSASTKESMERWR